MDWMRMRRYLLSFQFLAVLFASCASAQLTITEPEPAKGPIRQVSSSLPLATSTPWEGIAYARYQASSGTQIRVSVQYLMVDEVTRTAIYADLESTTIKTSVLVPGTADSADLQTNESPLRSSQQINAPSRVTTCVLSDSDTAAIMKKAIESESSDVTRSPSVMLLDGKQAEMNDVVQRPFVVDMQQDGSRMKPIVHVIDEGTRLRLLANLMAPAEDPSSAENDQPIYLSSELVISRVLDVRSDKVFGLDDEPLAVQIPVHQVTAAIASQRLAKGQTLLVDPHVTRTKSVQRKSEVPVLGKIPYVGRSFTNTATGTVEQHMLMLLQPSIENANRRTGDLEGD